MTAKSAELSKLSKGEMVTRLNSWMSRAKNFSKGKEEIGNRIVESTLTIAGGGISGVVRGWSDDDKPVEIPGTEIPVDSASATFLLLVGIPGLAGKASSHLTSLGAGIGAAATAFGVQKMVRKARRE